MGEPVSVIQSDSANGRRVRFETNRALTGMGHERYVAGEEIYGERPPDLIAKALIAHGGVEAVHIYAQTITVTLDDGANADGLKELVENMYIYYRPGVRVPQPEDFE